MKEKKHFIYPSSWWTHWVLTLTCVRLTFDFIFPLFGHQHRENNNNKPHEKLSLNRMRWKMCLAIARNHLKIPLDFYRNTCSQTCLGLIRALFFVIFTVLGDHVLWHFNSKAIDCRPNRVHFSRDIYSIFGFDKSELIKMHPRFCVHRIFFCLWFFSYILLMNFSVFSAYDFVRFFIFRLSTSQNKIFPTHSVCNCCYKRNRISQNLQKKGIIRWKHAKCVCNK